MPKLVALCGPLKGAEFALGGSDLTIGREASNRIVVDDPAASRNHCAIRDEAGRFILSDKKSRNGTYVNGLPIQERVLEHGDEIRTGVSVFLCVTADESSRDDSSSVKIDDSVRITRSTIVVGSDQSIYRRHRRGASQDLSVLFRITEAVHAAGNPEELSRNLLETAFETIAVDRGAVLLAGPAGEIVSTFALDREKGAGEQIRVSPQILDKVLREMAAVAEEYELEGAASAVYVMAVPLLCFDRAVGVLYLETSSAEAGGRMDGDRLQLFAAIGAIAGLAVENIQRVARLQEDNLRLQAEINLQHDMVGESPSMREVYRFIGKVAPTEATVLIEGESGTGKELVARAIHRNSPRAARPFVAINCAALTEALLESELFGHEKGSFTGALALKKGKFEMADGGTIFLDEIGELAPALQAKLLRVLQQREFDRVGGTKPVKVNVRVVAATNRDLAAASKSGAFRQDLYFRLNVVALRMPPLRERRQDIPALAAFFVNQSAERTKRTVTAISPKARDLLVQYDWPGNVRELENAMERAVVLGASGTILPEDLPESVHEAASVPGALGGTLHDAVREAKRHAIRSALEQAGWNYTEAAKLLDVHPNYLHRLIQNMNLKTELKRLALDQSSGPGA